MWSALGVSDQSCCGLCCTMHCVVLPSPMQSKVWSFSTKVWKVTVQTPSYHCIQLPIAEHGISVSCVQCQAIAKGLIVCLLCICHHVFDLQSSSNCAFDFSWMDCHVHSLPYAHVTATILLCQSKASVAHSLWRCTHCIYSLAAFRYICITLHNINVIRLHQWLFWHCPLQFTWLYLFCSQDSIIRQFNKLRRDILQVSPVVASTGNVTTHILTCMHVLSVMCLSWDWYRAKNLHGSLAVV